MSRKRGDPAATKKASAPEQARRLGRERRKRTKRLVFLQRSAQLVVILGHQRNVVGKLHGRRALERLVHVVKRGFLVFRRHLGVGLKRSNLLLQRLRGLQESLGLGIDAGQ